MFFSHGDVKVFGEFNPSTPQYHIEKLQFSEPTTEDGLVFLNSLKTYYFGEVKYDSMRSIELHSIAGKANSLLIGAEDGSAIEKFIIHTNMTTPNNAVHEDEVRIYGFDLNDTIAFVGEVFDTITEDVSWSSVELNSHRFIVDFVSGDHLALILNEAVQMSNLQSEADLIRFVA